MRRVLAVVAVLLTPLLPTATGEGAYRAKAVAGVLAAIGTEVGGRTLALGRNLVAYVVAADLVNLDDADAGGGARFRAWLSAVRTETLDGGTLISTHERRPNNWGTHAGASRVAADAYLGDRADLDRAAAVFRGWTGERATYAGFDFGDLSWQIDPLRPVGVNPSPAPTLLGLDLGGALPEEMRRGCVLQLPPCATNYPWGALAGATVQAQLLVRQGFDAWAWGNQALRRATQFLWDLDGRFGGWWAASDDGFVPALVDAAYGATFPVDASAGPGKNMGFTAWTHARPGSGGSLASQSPPVPTPAPAPKR